MLNNAEANQKTNKHKKTRKQNTILKLSGNCWYISSEVFKLKIATSSSSKTSDGTVATYQALQKR